MHKYTKNSSHFSAQANTTNQQNRSMENSSSSNYPLASLPEKQQKPAGKGSKSAVKLSTDAQSVAARERRHRISERFKILQSLVPGGTKMDTVTMLEEAIHYVKFLKAQIWLHQTMIGAACLDAGAYGYGGLDGCTTSYDPQKLEAPCYYYEDDEVRGYLDPAALLQPGFVNSGSKYEENVFYFS